ncbi:MAG: hypothetical protein WC412_05345 [Candidatus Omnitrophota bacterium]|jgi:hypothetical protein
MIRKIISLFILLSFFVVSPSLMASDIRMMGLANPFLMMPDSDTDWHYNPTYLSNASDQVYTQYIFGWGDFTQMWSNEFDGASSHSADGKGIARSHDGELGFIHSLNKGKLAITAGHSSFSDDLRGVVYSNGGIWTNDTHFPDDFNRDTNVTGAYVYPVSQEFSLGISGAWDRVNNRRKIFNVDDGYEDTTASIYNRWDCTLGLSWQIKPDMLLGLSAGAGQMPGDFYDDKNDVSGPTAFKGNGDYNGTQAHLLGNFTYTLNDRLNLSTIMSARLQKAKFGSDAGAAVGNNVNRDKEWEALFGLGGVYTINKDSGFLVGGGIYYSYNDWQHKYDQDAMGGLVFNSDREKSNTVQLRLGTEKKLFGELTGRGGIYYAYSFINKYELFNNNGAPYYEMSGDGYTRTLGIGTGVSYKINKAARLDLGFDIPIIADRVTKVNGNYMVTPGNSHRDSDFRNYRVGVNFAYLF